MMDASRPMSHRRGAGGAFGVVGTLWVISPEAWAGPAGIVSTKKGHPW